MNGWRGSVFQFFSDADDVDTWMLDMLRVVSSEDVGHDEASVQSLVKKHKVSLPCLSVLIPFVFATFTLLVGRWMMCN